MAIEIRTTLSPTPWQEQYDRMCRWRARIVAQDPNASYAIDNVHAFLITCFHLKDWLKSVDPAIGSAAERLVNENQSLQICADLANGLKHRMLDRRIRFQIPISLSTGEPPVVSAGGESLGEALTIADRCIVAWTEFLQEHGLLPL